MTKLTIGLSLLDFKQLLVDSGSIVQWRNNNVHVFFTTVQLLMVIYTIDLATDIAAYF